MLPHEVHKSPGPSSHDLRSTLEHHGRHRTRPPEGKLYDDDDDDDFDNEEIVHELVVALALSAASMVINELLLMQIVYKIKAKPW